MRILPAYVPAARTRARYRLLYGGAGSGKSVFAAMDLLATCERQPGERVLVVRRTARSCRISTFALLRDVLAAWEWLDVEVNKSDLTITFRNGSQILHAGLDDVDKLKSVAGVTRIWVEEATEVPEDDFNQVNLRLRGVAPERAPQLTLTFNPVSARHWIKRRFFDAPGEGDRSLGIYAVQTTFRDNPYAGPDYEAALAALPPHMRAVYMDGEWGTVVKGLVYPDWTTYEEDEEPGEAIYGLDFGFQAPAALVRVARRDTGLAAVDGLYLRTLLYESGLTNADLAEAVRALVPPGAIVYADAAEPKSIEELRRLGVGGIRPADKGPDSVRAGISFVQGHRLRIARHSQDLMNEAEMYRWATDRDGNPLSPERPEKGGDHALDAARYAVFTHYSRPVRRPRYHSLRSA